MMKEVVAAFNSKGEEATLPKRGNQVVADTRRSTSEFRLNRR